MFEFIGVVSPSSQRIAGLNNQSSRLRLMLAVCDLMSDSNSDAINGRCHTHTAVPVVGFVVVNFRQRCGRAMYSPSGGVARQIPGMRCSAPL